MIISEEAVERSKRQPPRFVQIVAWVFDDAEFRSLRGEPPRTPAAAGGSLNGGVTCINVLVGLDSDGQLWARAGEEPQPWVLLPEFREAT